MQKTEDQLLVLALWKALSLKVDRLVERKVQEFQDELQVALIPYLQTFGEFDYQTEDQHVSVDYPASSESASAFAPVSLHTFGQNLQRTSKVSIIADIGLKSRFEMPPKDIEIDRI